MRSTMHAWYEAVRRIRWLLDAEYDQSHPVTMKTIAAAKFKEQCLALLDSVADEGLVITKRGKPVARLVPVRPDGKSLIGVLRGKLKVRGNLLSTGVRWDARRRASPAGPAS